MNVNTVLAAFRRTVRLGTTDKPKHETFGTILGSTTQLVFLMVGILNDRGETPTNNTIGAHLGRRPSTVSKATGALVKSGWLVKYGKGFKVAS